MAPNMTIFMLMVTCIKIFFKKKPIKAYVERYPQIAEHCIVEYTEKLEKYKRYFSKNKNKTRTKTKYKKNDVTLEILTIFNLD